MYHIYRILSFFALLLMPFYAIWRILSGKDEFYRIKERFGFSSVKRSGQRVVWIHAASVGESNSILPVIKIISESYPDLQILLTTGTMSSAKLVKSKLPQNAVHQYIVYDLVPIVKRFLNYWKPALVIFVESEIWPNLMSYSADMCTIIMLNGRMSDRSFKKWQRYQGLAEYLLNKIEVVLAQSKKDMRNFQILGASRVVYTGNLKYSTPVLTYDEQELKSLRARVVTTGGSVEMIEKNKFTAASRKILMAASTHVGEEEQIANVHKQLRAIYPDLLTIISPRHPERMSEILEKLHKYNLNIAVRSFGDKINESTDIYLADTMGEYGLFFRLSQIVFVGGSLVPHGGQNLLEPAKLNNAIVVGPYMYNFTEVTEDFACRKALVKVKDDEELFLSLEYLFAHITRAESFAEASQKIALNSMKIIDVVMGNLEPFLKNIR